MVRLPLPGRALPAVVTVTSWMPAWIDSTTQAVVIVAILYGVREDKE